MVLVVVSLLVVVVVQTCDQRDTCFSMHGERVVRWLIKLKPDVSKNVSEGPDHIIHGLDRFVCQCFF